MFGISLFEIAIDVMGSRMLRQDLEKLVLLSQFQKTASATLILATSPVPLLPLEPRQTFAQELVVEHLLVLLSDKLNTKR